IGALDASAIARVRDEAWPDVRDADELVDVLSISGFLTDAEGVRGRDDTSWLPHFVELTRTGRAAQVGSLWVARDRIAEVLAMHPEARSIPDFDITAGGSRPDAIRELLRGRMGITGPSTAS